MEKKKKTIEWQSFRHTDELGPNWAKLFELAKRALDHSYSPYSDFQVGAAIRLSNGEILTGSNQENAAYPSGLCAERTVLFYAGHQFSGIPITHLAITTRKWPVPADIPASPCGACLQVISETQNRQADIPIEIALMNPDGFGWKFDSINDLLPFRFHLKTERP